MATDTDAPVKERSVPKPVFTDAEAGAREFPSSTSRSYNYFTPAKRRATVYEDVTVDVQPDPERHLLQGWIYGFADGDRRLPAGVDDAEVLQLARVPRSQRGVGADDLPQQRQRRAADRPEPGQRQGRPRVRRLEPRLDQDRRAPRRRLGARRARHRHARLPARPARRPDQHDQQRAVGGLGAQAALRPGPDPLQPRAHRRRSRASTAQAHKDAWINDPIWQGVRENVERHHRRSATGPRRSSPPRSCSSRWSASCSARSSSCRWRRRRATSSPRR